MLLFQVDKFRAENGALTVMIGGDQADFDKAKDKIECYSKKMKLLGGPGNGQLAKMVNQICIAGLVQKDYQKVLILKRESWIKYGRCD